MVKYRSVTLFALRESYYKKKAKSKLLNIGLSVTSAHGSISESNQGSCLTKESLQTSNLQILSRLRIPDTKKMFS